MGGGSARPESLSHRRLEERAVREDWPLPPDVRNKILRRLVKTVDEDAIHEGLERPGHREVIAASRTLIIAYNTGQRLAIDREKLELMKLRAAAAVDATADPAGAIDPAAAERALKALNGETSDGG